jgi:hypothetical protein
MKSVSRDGGIAVSEHDCIHVTRFFHLKFLLRIYENY